jgi:hypothetical protein
MMSLAIISKIVLISNSYFHIGFALSSTFSLPPPPLPLPKIEVIYLPEHLGIRGHQENQVYQKDPRNRKVETLFNHNHCCNTG